MVRAFKLQSITKSRIFSPASHSIFSTPKADELSVGRCGNVVQLRGKAYAASARADPPPQRSGKRIPKARRKAMVESYVNEYRALNDGKFPTAHDALKQVGGSYYVIREILQELKYNIRTSPTSNRSEYSMQKKEVNDDEILAAEVHDHRSARVAEDVRTKTGSRHIACKNVMADDTGHGTFEVVTQSETVHPSGNTMSNVVTDPEVQSLENNNDLENKDDHTVAHATQNHLQKEITREEDKSEEKTRPDVFQASHNTKVEQMKENVHTIDGEHEDDKEKKGQGDELHADATQAHLGTVKHNKENNGQEPIASEVIQETQIPQSKAKNFPRSDEMGKKVKIDTAERPSMDTDSQEKSTFWGNLKSFADGIVKIWKKL